MNPDRIPDLSTVESPPRRDEISYYDLEIGERRLGKGGQTVVYEARVPGPEPPATVAVRQLSDRGFTRSVDKEEVASFLGRAETWASLARRERTEPRWRDSDHIVGVVAIGEKLPWAALEYMDGGSLADRLDGGDGLPIEQAVWIAERLCRGLNVAHNTGVAHLDLKPGNVLFRETGPETWDVPKIADWGLARELLDGTSDSMDVLSVRYAAPEQFDREAFGRPGTATDTYQLGAVVYALLTGEPPYTGGDRNVMFDVVSDELPPPPSRRRGEVSAELDAVVRTALEPEKADRYGSIETFRRALRAVRLGGQLPPAVVERIEPAGADPVERWPMDGFGPARRGTPSGHAGPEPPVTARRLFDAGGNVQSRPAVAEGTVYLGNAAPLVDGRHLYAVDTETGRERWRCGISAMDSSPAVADGTVYVGSADNHLYALDASDGTERWRFRTRSVVASSPTIADGTVYVGSRDDSLYAVDAATGRERWEFATAEWVDSSPAVADGTAYVGGQDGSLYAVDADTGREQWQFDTDGLINASPAVVDDTVYVGSRDGNLYAVDAATGRKRWAFDTSGWVDSSPAVADGTVYVLRRDESPGPFVDENDTDLYALDAATGKGKWQFDPAGAGTSSPAAADGTVYVGGSDGLCAVDAATGEQQWRADSFGVTSSPSVVDGTVYVGSADGHVYAVSGD